MSRIIDLDELTDEDWEIARKAVEDVLIEWRDERRSVLRRNGFAVHERNGEPNGIIRLSTEMGMKIGLNAIWKARQ